MSSQSKRRGLYFADENLDLARANQHREPIRSALTYLDRASDDPLAAAQLAGLRYCFFGDVAAAAAALQMPTSADFRQTLGWLSALDMLRGVPTRPSWQDDWLTALSARLEDTAAIGPLDELWRGALLMAAGIILEHDAHFARGQDVYRQAIHTRIHPEGFLKGIVDAPGAAQSYRRQVSGTCALVLMAEMAGHVGVDLWSMDNRGVTPITATAYLLYYYFYPENWKWEAGLTRAATAALMRHQGAFIEIVHRRQALPAAEHLLAEQRPMFSAEGGGLTTLTHGIAPPPQKRRWSLF